MSDPDDSEDWLTHDNFENYIKMCRSEIRTTSPSTAAWNTFFRVISGKSRKSTAYDDRLSQEFQSDDSVRTECSSFLDEFSASSLSRYPWRLAVVELAI